jgi:hypothetical protein
MSDTPQSDEMESCLWNTDKDRADAMARLSRKFERELSELRKEVRSLRGSAARHSLETALINAIIDGDDTGQFSDYETPLTERVAELRKDKARLDWLDEGNCLIGLAGKRFVAEFERQDYGEFPTARAAIDAAIAQPLKSTP